MERSDGEQGVTMTETKYQLLATTAVALSFAIAAPAAAQSAGPEDPQAAAETEALDVHAEERLSPMTAGGSGGTIRPFGGGINPNAGAIRGFAGPIVGTAGAIRGFSDPTASAGAIRGFAGAIRGFAGAIRGFTTTVNTTTGMDAAFWGSLKPQAGTLSVSGGAIRGFMGELDVMGGAIRGFSDAMRTSTGTLLTYQSGKTTYDGMHGAIMNMVAKSEAQFGPAVQARTGKTFSTGFTSVLFNKYGIKANDPTSLVGMDEFGIEMFLLDWQDNLLNYSGQDQVDHWMKSIGWSPALTQSLGNGADTKIGILDYGTTTFDGINTVVTWGGYANAGKNYQVHGSAVSSLITGKHDGRGVMGIAPDAQVIGYNPFDYTGTAGWTDITNGVKYMLSNGASVINASLGVPGKVLSSGWNDVFLDKAISDQAKKHVFVLAAGNEGVTHHKDDKVRWDFDRNPNIILVGSVDHTGTISQFSNRPGEAQFDKVAGNDPLGTDKLRDRFIVAPGEFLLVNDGQGGVTRMSGTSFAAPLVSGTIALVHDRWPWLADNPVDTTSLILYSARDVGEAGVDGVYGRGMLDVQKALEPGNFFSLKWKQSVNGVVKDTTATNVLNTTLTTRNTWEANSVYFTVFEGTGTLKDSYRDFHIPMSTKLIGQNVGTTQEQFSGYLQSRFWTWFNANKKVGFAGEGCDGCDDNGFTARYMASPVAKVAGLNATAFAVPRTYKPGLRQSDVPFDTGLALRSADGRFGFRFGSGEGAAFTGQKGFGLLSDYDVLTGGANPYLGLASGAGYAAVDMKIGDKVTVSTGVSRQNAVMDFDQMNAQERQILGSIDPYAATANTMVVTYQANDKFSANIGYTLLNEDSALLGVRSLNPMDMRDGTTTDATTIGADYKVARGLTMSVTGTVGRTRTGDSSQGIAVGEGGLISSAWQVAVAKNGVLDGNDRARLTLAQPLHVERGQIGFTGVEVIDRQTGELGDVTQFANYSGGNRRFVAEAMYGRTMIDGAAEFSFFGRADLGANDRTEAAVTLGGSFRLGF